jgi:hypothetical protein
MTPNAATEKGSPGSGAARKSQTDSLVAELLNEFASASPCEIRVAVLQAEENLWPKKDAYLVLDRARELLRRGAV